MNQILTHYYFAGKSTLALNLSNEVNWLAGSPSLPISTVLPMGG
jgi:hypothetical protein